MKKLNLFGPVYPYEDCVNASSVAKFLAELNESEEFIVYLNSPGGSVFEGLAIYNLLAEHQEQMTIKIIGEASSIASVIACAGAKGKTLIAESALMLIHKPWTFSIIDEDYIKKLNKQLGTIKNSIIKIYSTKSSKTEDELDEIMTAAEYKTAEECVEIGLADATYSPLKADTEILKKSEKIKNEIINKYSILNLKTNNTMINRGTEMQTTTKTLDEANIEIGKLQVRAETLELENKKTLASLEEYRAKYEEKEQAINALNEKYLALEKELNDFKTLNSTMQKDKFVMEAKMFCEKMFQEGKLTRAEINGKADLSKDELPDKVKKLVALRETSQELYALEIAEIENKNTSDYDYLSEPLSTQNNGQGSDLVAYADEYYNNNKKGM
ncbi:MAG: head maturation protease, ClpP-related [Candidatus Paceibacterota bacterium]|jgi:ATP-dependent Clp endopeptidase proteolytic subunit ClpP